MNETYGAVGKMRAHFKSVQPYIGNEIGIEDTLDWFRVPNNLRSYYYHKVYVIPRFYCYYRTIIKYGNYEMTDAVREALRHFEIPESIQQYYADQIGFFEILEFGSGRQK